MGNSCRSFVCLQSVLPELLQPLRSDMGHRNTDMIIKVYSRYIEDGSGSPDGVLLDKAFRETKDKDK